MRSRKFFFVAIAVATLLAVSAVAPAGASHGANGKICVVLDAAGLDSSFNAAAAEGAAEADRRLHVDAVVAESADDTEILANIDAFVTAGDCDLIYGVGFIVAALMDSFISANPDQNFVVLDTTLPNNYPNVAEIGYSVDEAAFLAGYVAAGASDTGKVGVFGGLPFPSVTTFMDGYALGVERYNNTYGTTVEVLGWDPDLQTGLFTFTFEDPAAGQALARELYDLGADTVFPVAGFTSIGALEEAELRAAAGDHVRVVGVDADWSAEFGDPERVILTSVIKDLGPTVFNQAEALVAGMWTGGQFAEGLAEWSVDIAPFYKLQRAVPGLVRRDLRDLRAGIIDGSIPTQP